MEGLHVKADFNKGEIIIYLHRNTDTIVGDAKVTLTPFSLEVRELSSVDNQLRSSHIAFDGCEYMGRFLRHGVLGLHQWVALLEESEQDELS